MGDRLTRVLNGCSSVIDEPLGFLDNRVLALAHALFSLVLW
jgi:hypothetical protein